MTTENGNNRSDETCPKRVKELEEEIERWKTVFNSIPDGVTIHSKDFTIERANESVARLLGLAPEEIIGKKCYLIFHHKDEPIPECPALLTIKEGVENSVRVFEPTLGKYLSVLTSPILGEDGEVVGYVHSVRDVTEIVEAEEKLKRESEFRAVLLRILGHDLRQPLQIISGYADMLCATQRDEKSIKYCRNLKRGVKLAEDILESIRIYTRLSSGKIEKRYIPKPLREIVSEAVESVIEKASDRGTEIIVQYDGVDEAAVVRVFEGINNVLVNLLDNAIKYGPEGQKIKLTIRRRDGDLVFSVEDQGPGIPEEEFQRIFEDFTRLKGEIEIPGIGLGLTIVKGLVEFYGGEVVVENVKPHGARFTFTIPQEDI
ncbi:MAG: PAS domain S-box protein [Thermoplasmata archaeon]|nr:PAS domain S-box protein [Thermoplasmata archaeon]